MDMYWPTEAKSGLHADTNCAQATLGQYRGLGRQEKVEFWGCQRVSSGWNQDLAHVVES